MLVFEIIDEVDDDEHELVVDDVDVLDNEIDDEDDIVVLDEVDDELDEFEVIEASMIDELVEID